MDLQLQKCLENQPFDYILPFLWLHGESHEELKREILAIKESGCNSFCAESRPYPAFCEDQWWEDFAFILETARQLDMKVWLLDDRHFPSGFANCAIDKGLAPQKKVLRLQKLDVVGPEKDSALLYRQYLEEGETLLSAVAYKRTGEGIACRGEPIDLTDNVRDGLMYFDIPEGVWRVFFLIQSRQPVGNPKTIDMLDPQATDLMISRIYQPHFDHFADYFGNTFQGFFSDEPAFLNHGGSYFCRLGTDMALPWRQDIPSVLAQKLGKSEDQILSMLPALWTDIGDITPLRVAYMDTITAIYAQNFSGKLGSWCRAHGVQYIGHIVEDMGACSRLAHSAGHYFRALDAQDMAGIDVVLHQILPGHNDMPHTPKMFDDILDPEFFVYALAKLAASHSHINPLMQNRAMCEIFGAYGFAEGVPVMKKLADHMLASGINRFVPHAFSPKYPDKDCPPHFYAKGHNPQFHQFGQLMRYMQRVVHLLEGGIHKAPVAVYYNAECEWAGDLTDTYQAAAKMLTRQQIDFDFLSEDYIVNATLENGHLQINDESYSLLLLPGCRYITPRLRTFLEKMAAENVPFSFRDVSPEGFECYVNLSLPREISLATAAPHVRYYHLQKAGKDFFLFKNDGEEIVNTIVEGLPGGDILVYDAWNNRCYRQTDRRVVLCGGESVIWILGEETQNLPVYRHPLTMDKQPAKLLWNITAGDKEFKDSALFNITGKEGMPRFSGTILYETQLQIPADATALDLGIVGETAAVTLNGIPCGSRIAPPYTFDISKAKVPGENRLQIRVVNNPAYGQRDPLSMFMQLPPSGLLGPVVFLK